MWLELTLEDDKKVYANASQFIMIYPPNEAKMTDILTSAGIITVKEPSAFIQAKVGGPSTRFST